MDQLVLVPHFYVVRNGLKYFCLDVGFLPEGDTMEHIRLLLLHQKTKKQPKRHACQSSMI